MQTVINDLLTNYAVYGSNKNPCLLILHGWQRNIEDWKKVAKTLSETHYVVLLDLPGFGGTVQPKTTFGVHDCAKFVEDFTNKLEITRFTLLGHSFGGRIGIILGSNSSSIDKLILVDSAGTETLNPMYKSFLFFAKTLSKIFPRSVVNIIKRNLGSKDYLNAGPMQKIFKKVISEDLTYLLKDIKIPTMVVWGSDDSILDVATTKVFKKNIKNCIVRIVWGAGHHPHLEKEEKFVEIAKGFLNDE